jgi:hypothetical protein
MNASNVTKVVNGKKVAPKTKEPSIAMWIQAFAISFNKQTKKYYAAWQIIEVTGTVTTRQAIVVKQIFAHIDNTTNLLISSGPKIKRSEMDALSLLSKELEGFLKWFEVNFVIEDKATSQVLKLLKDVYDTTDHFISQCRQTYGSFLPATKPSNRPNKWKEKVWFAEYIEDYQARNGKDKYPNANAIRLHMKKINYEIPTNTLTLWNRYYKAGTLFHYVQDK